MKVSFVIPCHNGRRYLRRCLDSIAERADDSWEAVVVDDGSTEDIHAVTEAFAPLVRYFRQPKQGVSAARNTGIRETRGTYIHFLDADDYLIEADGLSEQIRCLDAYPDVGLVYGQALRVDLDEQPIDVRRCPHSETSFVHSGADEIGNLIYRNYVVTSTTMVRRSILDRVGVFRTTLPISEDWDLWLRIAQVSAVGYVSKPIAAYRQWGGTRGGHRPTTLWVQTHTDVLDTRFADESFAQRFSSLRDSAYTAMYADAAVRASSHWQIRLAWQYAAKARLAGGGAHEWALAKRCLRHFAKGRLPIAVRNPLRDRLERLVPMRRAPTSAELRGSQEQGVPLTDGQAGVTRLP
jgi:glycosyltransferase involved in cell wall biosynthesis